MEDSCEWKWIEHRAFALVLRFNETGDIVLTKEEIEDFKSWKDHHQIFMAAFNHALRDLTYNEFRRLKARKLITKKLAKIYFEKDTLLTRIKMFFKH